MMKRPWYAHLLFWIAAWMLQSFLFGGGESFGFYLTKNLAIVPLQAIVVYSTLYLLFWFMKEGRFALYGLSGVALVYLVFTFSFLVIDLSLSFFYPEIVFLGKPSIIWTTNFWSIVSGSALYSIPFFVSTIYLMTQVTSGIPEIENKVLLLKEGKKIHRLDLDKILFVEGMREYVGWNTQDNKVITLHSLTKLEDILKERGFVRIHRSYIVNADFVEVVRSNTVEVAGKEIPIGRSYKEKVLSSFEKPI